MAQLCWPASHKPLPVNNNASIVRWSIILRLDNLCRDPGQELRNNRHQQEGVPDLAFSTVVPGMQHATFLSRSISKGISFFQH
jgi:hypothetical protein